MATLYVVMALFLQLSWIKFSLLHTEIFSIAESATRLVNLDILKQPVDDDAITASW